MIYRLVRDPKGRVNLVWAGRVVRVPVDMDELTACRTFAETWWHRGRATEEWREWELLATYNSKFAGTDREFRFAKEPYEINYNNPGEFNVVCVHPFGKYPDPKESRRSNLVRGDLPSSLPIP